jgi:hypothetical protein
MKPQEVLDLLESEMEKNGLLAEGWTYGLDGTRMQFGVCSDTRRYIGISRRLATINPDHHTRLCILHEIAHALVGTQHNHDRVWAECCVRIGGDGKEFYGCEVQQPRVGRKPQATFNLSYNP